jgi:diguanylate cyclase (GGDEF)-like protein
VSPTPARVLFDPPFPRPPAGYSYNARRVTERSFDAEPRFDTAGDLRERVADVLIRRSDAIVHDSAAIFPSGADQALDGESSVRLAALLVQLLVACVRDGRIDPRTGLILDLRRLASERNLSADRLFGVAYLTERTALDELALDRALGATTEPWPIAAQLVRRASFQLLAAYADRITHDPSADAVVDALTTLHTRTVVTAALEKELQRVERTSSELAFIVFDVDRMTAINRHHGFGVGDRVLERLAILVRQYFRVHDWVGRYGEDAVCVVLSPAEAGTARTLAERVRDMVEARLVVRDHHSGGQTRVTVSVGVVTVRGVPGDLVPIERVLVEADRAVGRAKKKGRNRVECAAVPPASMTVSQAARFLDLTPADVRRLVASGVLRPITGAKELRIGRIALEAHKRAR